MEGTSAVLLQSGLNESWWADSMECYTYLGNVTDLLSDGKTPYERRFGQLLKKEPIIPFGSSVEYYPISAKDQSRIHQFGKKVLPGLFLGNALYAGRIWKGDVLVADLEELETMDASEIYSKRLNAKEVIFSPRKRRIYLPSRRWNGKTLWRRSGTEIIHFDTGPTNSRRKSSWFAGRITRDSTCTTFSRLISGCRWSYFRWLIYRHHVEPRVKLYSPGEESFPIPLKYIDVSRTTHTNLDVFQESRIDDFWNIDGSRDLSDPWTGFTQFTLLEEKAPDGYMWSGERLTKRQASSRSDHLWPESGRNCQEMPRWRKDNSGHMKNQNSIMPENYEEFISLTLRTRNLRRPSRMLARNWKHQWLVLCLASHARKASMGRLVARLMIWRLNLRVSWKPVRPQECVWKNLYQITMRTILHEKGTIHCNIIIWYTNLFLCLKPWRYPQQKQQWMKNGRNLKRLWRGT